MTNPSKKYLLRAVELMSEQLMDVLDIDSTKVEIKIVSNRDKELKEMGLSHVAGLTESSKGGHRVWIVWNNQRSHKDALGTLIHELLHVRLYRNKMNHEKEEILVQQLEELVLKFIPNY